MAGEVTAERAAGAAGSAGVVQVTLRNQGKLNAMSRAMWLQLRSVFEGVQRSAEVRCVLLEPGGPGLAAAAPAGAARAPAAAPPPQTEQPTE